MHSPECQDYKVKEMDKLPHFMVLKFYVETGVGEQMSKNLEGSAMKKTNYCFDKE